MLKLKLNFVRYVCLAALCAALPRGPALAESLKMIYQFTGGADGGQPASPLTPDGSGNLYGTTHSGGDQSCKSDSSGCGTIFKLDRAGHLTTLHTFEGGASGQLPSTGVSLLNGSLYGSAIDNTAGHYGMLFLVKHDGSGFTLLHEFSGADGEYGVGLMQPALNGGALGLSGLGGRGGEGTLYYAGPLGRFAVVHNFEGGAGDGSHPNELVEDASGNLFGSAYGGGGCTTHEGGCGVIFEYAQQTKTYSVIYAFQNEADGYAPMLGAIAPDGTLYGVTDYGGSHNDGALFALTPSGGVYRLAVLAPIKSKFSQDVPLNPPALSPNGTLVGALASGGNYQYLDGRYSVIYGSPAYPLGEYLVPPLHPSAILGTSYYGGSVPCEVPYNHSGCGFIFRAGQ
jgi:uncharacterized repeat protein (TIGR03803 family)